MNLCIICVTKASKSDILQTLGLYINKSLNHPMWSITDYHVTLMLMFWAININSCGSWGKHKKQRINFTGSCSLHIKFQIFFGASSQKQYGSYILVASLITKILWSRLYKTILSTMVRGGRSVPICLVTIRI